MIIHYYDSGDESIIQSSSDSSHEETPVVQYDIFDEMYESYDDEAD